MIDLDFVHSVPEKISPALTSFRATGSQEARVGLESFLLNNGIDFDLAAYDPTKKCSAPRISLGSRPRA